MWAYECLLFIKVPHGLHPLVSTFYRQITAIIVAGDKIEKNEIGWACGTYG